MERNSHTDIEIIHFNFLFEGCLYMNIHVNATLTIHIFFLKEKIMLFEWIDYLFSYTLLQPLWKPMLRDKWTLECSQHLDQGLLPLQMYYKKKPCKWLEFSLDFLHVVLLSSFKSHILNKCYISRTQIYFWVIIRYKLCLACIYMYIHGT